MRMYSDEDKKIIKIILSQQTEPLHFLGASLINDYFGKNKLALVIFETRIASLLLPLSDNKEANECYKKLVELLSLLEHLEQEGLIYCIDNHENNPLLFYSSKNLQLGIDNSNKKYINDEWTITIDTAQIVLNDKTRKPIMAGQFCSQILSAKLIHFITGFIYSTSSLNNFQRNGFKTQEQLQFEKELATARRSLCISRCALFVSLLVPILSIPLTNKYGYSTIQEQQYKQILKHIDRYSSTNSDIPILIDTIKFLPFQKKDSIIHDCNCNIPQ